MYIGQYNIYARWLSCLHCLHCRLTAIRSWVPLPHGALLALGGRSSPECTVLKWAISQAFLSPRVHKGFPPVRTPTEKTCKITELKSIPDQRWTVHFTWSPGAAKLLLGGP